LDDTARLLAEGYRWLPGRLRRSTGGVARARIMGQPAVGLRGPEGVRFFYDERHVRRGGALPEPLRGTLFGKGGVHGLDGEMHRVRKSMFVTLLTDPKAVAALVEQVADAWDEAVPQWTGDTVLFDETSRILTRGVCRWAGLPVTDDMVAPLASDLVSLVDGFGSLGRRHWQARRARGRCEDWLAGLVEQVRAGEHLPAAGSPLEVVASHRDAGGELLSPHVAAVELLNIIRPTVAIAWFTAYAAHALHSWPEHRDRLAGEDPQYLAAFVHEVRRYYPFAPFVGGVAVTDLTWRGEAIRTDSLVLLDLYGQNHDPALWGDPDTFRPERFLEHPVERDELVPQGGGDPSTGHRCPGELITITLLEALCHRLAQLNYEVPDQDLSISLRRFPARLASGFVFSPTRLQREPRGTDAA
jgi:fatty-acid peroxygenase